MSDPVIFEASDGVAPWMQIGSLSPGDPLGSITSFADGHRDVVVFGWSGYGQCGVWRSRGGVDVETIGVRELLTTGLELLSDLTEPYQLTVVSESGTRLHVRWRLDGAAESPLH